MEKQGQDPRMPDADSVCRDRAVHLFMEGYNCAQAVLLAFSDILPLDQETLSKLASPFGGGMGRLRETCGAVSGMLLAAGLLYGYAGPETGNIKTELYTRVQSLASEFEVRHGSLTCRDLLGLSVRHDRPEASPRTPDFYEKRPCAGFIGDAAEILEAFIREHLE